MRIICFNRSELCSVKSIHASFRDEAELCHGAPTSALAKLSVTQYHITGSIRWCQVDTVSVYSTWKTTKTEIFCHFDTINECRYHGRVIKSPWIRWDTLRVTYSDQSWSMKLSLVVRKRVFGSFRLGHTAQLQKLAWGLKFWLQKLETLHYLDSEQQRRWSDCAGWSAPLSFAYDMTHFLMAWFNLKWFAMFI